MFNDEDDDTPVAVDPELDTELADAEGGDEDDEADVAAAARKPKRAAAKKAVVKAAAKANAGKPAKSVKKAAPAKAASKPAKKAAAKAAKAKKPAAKKAAKAPAPPAGLSGVKAGAHTLWVSKDLARALTSKDRRKLKALLKRAEKRGKSKSSGLAPVRRGLFEPPFAEDFGDVADQALFLGSERRVFVAVDVDLPHDAAVLAADEHDELRLRLEAARQVVVGRGDVGDVHVLVARDRGSADADAHFDARVLGRRADVGTELQRRPVEHVNTHPVELR